ncbi:sulfotransferase domain-containing protein [Roseovarius rhodophyticola]|uniref:Sulfotransferase domain-containing protein n=1 Tax=Roseovarius rhodophyticola TaxID=3080827 RepID=A0ABZ2TFT6_9RHOB|nr:sulfotransferase domain-containing protein [Roseovarius sp. W115]MDV2928839.1 sulfotransferase domain-containing protein [Roseovarius sp. W115]
MKKSIVWLASYPKSGNTWTRVFLANYLANPDKPLSINQVRHFGMGDAIAKTYRMVSNGRVDFNDPHSVLRYRDPVLQAIIRNNADVNFVKTHNICGAAFGVELIPERYTRCGVYILRNPMDIVLSFARHFDKDLEQAIDAMANPEHVIQDATTAAQFLGNWSEHVKGWAAERRFPMLVLRYEDLQSDPQTNFSKVLEHVGVTVEPDRVAKAVEFSSFDVLRKQEEKEGFVEKPEQAERFFAKGTSGQWKTDLPANFAKRLRKDHRKIMKKYGYIE